MALPDEDDLLRRAMAAYFKAGSSVGGILQQPSKHSAVEKVNGLTYVAIRNGSDLLAAYRLKNDGALRRLTRWPAELNS